MAFCSMKSSPKAFPCWILYINIEKDIKKDMQLKIEICVNYTFAISVSINIVFSDVTI